MKFDRYDHCGGIAAIPQTLCDEVEDALVRCKIKPALRAAPTIRDDIMPRLIRAGWSDEVSVSIGSQITITSTRSNVGLCLQTGNMSRLYADLMKLQKLFLDNSIKAGIMAVPNAEAARALGQNIANYTRLTKELEIFRKVVHMPLIVYGFE